MITVKVWNQSKLDSFAKHGESLEDYEARTGTALSSVLKVNDERQLNDILSAVHNETDVQLDWALCK